ncbi:MAG: hypothetical protein WC363_03355 [Candidatus Izemoplasmatales bacterium]|jgi:hypothetical protein
MMKKQILFYSVILALNILYFLIPFPILLVLVYGIQSVLTLHIYREFNALIGNRKNVIISLWVFQFLAQFSGLYYVTALYFSKPIYGIIIAFCLSAEIWVIAIINFVRAMKK